MIFLTVGTQLPFDRLVRAVDAWAGRSGSADIVAQIGDTALVPRNMRHQPYITPAEFARHASTAELIISHAGMGTILSALRLGKPLLVMPRRAALGEHRNEHQYATARRFRELGRIAVAMDEEELVEKLDASSSLGATEKIGPHASQELLACVKAFIEADH